MSVQGVCADNSSGCVNYKLQRAARDQQGKFREDAINAVRRNFYLDALMKSQVWPKI